MSIDFMEFLLEFIQNKKNRARRPYSKLTF